MTEQSPAEALYFAALALPPAERATYLDAHCPDPALRARVEKLLAAQPKVGDFLDAAAATAAHGEPPTAAQLPDTEAHSSGDVGQLVADRYKLLERIGEGGMGTVWMAEQRTPVKRLVALKLIKPGLETRAVLARFEAERQALAIMDHPSIARVLDAGETADGRPFFVMELVKGVPITKFCDEAKLTPRQRLELFVPVCQAIQHAHQKGVIHRDIKPGNVLVALYDGRPVPKVIDFGVAKAAGQPLTEKTLHTGFGAVVGTPEYMSPEQASFNQLDIDTRSDVYSLGVLLYELLTGGPPFSGKELETAGLLEMLRVVREQEPPRPSTKLATSAKLPALAATRGTEPARLAGLVRGEVDWIVMKALEKDRNRRYETALGLAADVQRHLAGEPVQAVPPSVGYRLRKLVRRHRGRVVAASLVVLALVGGTVGTTLGFVEARRQEQEARRQAGLADERAEGERQAREAAEANETKVVAAAGEEKKARQTAEAVLGFVQDKVFAAARPKGEDSGLGYDVKLVDAIVAALPAVDVAFAGQPLSEARLRMTIGDSFHRLGKFDLSGTQFAAARAIYARHLGPDHPDTMNSLWRLSNSYTLLRRFGEVVRLYEEVLARRTVSLGPDHPDTLNIMIHLAQCYSGAGRHAEAVAIGEKGLALAKAKLGSDHPDTLTGMAILASCYHVDDRYAEAVRLAEEGLALGRAKFGPDHPDLLGKMYYLGYFYATAGRHADAVRVREEWLARVKALDRPHDGSVLFGMDDLAASYAAVGRPAEALALREEILARRRAKYGPEGDLTLFSMASLADSYSALGRHAEALKLCEETLARRRATLGADHPETLKSVLDLSCAYANTGDVDRAITLDRECLAGLARVDPPNPFRMARARASAGSRLLSQRRWAEAEPVLRESLTFYQAKFRDDWKVFHAQSLLGGALLGLGKTDEARPLLVSGYEGMRERLATIPAPDRGEVAAAAGRLVRLAEATNQPDEAERWRAERAKFPFVAPMPRPAVK